ncbi:SRPBCC family protein [Flavisolibacter ginsengisoli]|uniref:Activator of Hsp90 ATPase homolog 1-like protein n=1 Tax=Flavisolibacter ginsengisoli DSM 18119 TaxID=1121884 RepID=A0A1M5BTF9_9BACT|nr:SRPBCC domain-containing protein [Flavisolibacter ginsengisoli]SHF45611.1 Activator of Hsp90 ATPase homolog 1-like protein [Flavisolibacter ginsengisoli DSM 18119]
MENRDYAITVEVAKSSQEVFDAISDVTNWWSKDFEGNSTKLNDEFTINHPNAHYSKQRLIEVVPNKKVVWLVIDSNLNWIKSNKQEWTNTKMIFEVNPKDDKTELRFTHEGLTPDKECCAMCVKGWDLVVGNWLLHLISTGKPSIDMAKAAEIRNQAAKANASFHSSISANISAKEAFEGICKVNEWWGNIEGETGKLNDEFIYRPNDTWVKFKITECNDRKIIWHVTDCYLHFQTNKTEWTDTEVIFEIEEKGHSSRINFKHLGLIPEVECYENCIKGWTHYFQGSLLQLLTTGKGQLK